jgi:hypothetical protein
MKLVSTLVIMGILISSSIANAQQGIFLNYSSAVKLSADIEYFKKTVDNQKLQINEYKDINLNLNNISELKDVKITGLIKDYSIQEQRATQLQEIYTVCNKDLIKEKLDKPSRYTWFSIGAISALVLGIVTAFAIK